MRWRKAAILGVGLLGGSLGLALRRRGLAAEVHGFVRRAETAREALRVGAVDQAGQDLAAVVSGADLVVFCTPVAQMAVLASDVVPHLLPGALVTDVGSVKSAVVAAVEGPVLGAGGSFVGSHPMAGSEKVGVSAAREDLFTGAVCVLTPTPATRLEASEGVRALWEGLGARLLWMDPEQHDTLVARSSHLPHLLASALAAYVLDPRQPPELSQLCASGFRDTTRVASGSPEMWRDIALANREAILAAMDGFDRFLGRFRSAVESADPMELEGLLRVAAQRRAAWQPPCLRGDGE